MGEGVHSARQGAQPDTATDDARAEPSHPGALPHTLQAGSLGFTRFSPGRTRS
jgi:hypothetical protein